MNKAQKLSGNREDPLSWFLQVVRNKIKGHPSRILPLASPADVIKRTNIVTGENSPQNVEACGKNRKGEYEEDLKRVETRRNGRENAGSSPVPIKLRYGAV